MKNILLLALLAALLTGIYGFRFGFHRPIGSDGVTIPAGEYVLLEIGDYVLMETGDKIVLE